MWERETVVHISLRKDGLIGLPSWIGWATRQSHPAPATGTLASPIADSTPSLLACNSECTSVGRSGGLKTKRKDCSVVEWRR